MWNNKGITMTTVICTYQLPVPKSREQVMAIFKMAAETVFKDLDGLNSKQFCYDETTGKGLSVYNWISKDAAEQFFYSPDFVKNFEAGLGTIPNLEILDALLVVDNRVGDITINE